MSYRIQYDRLAKRAREAELRRQIPSLAEPLKARTINSLIHRQGAYLSWSFALIVMQLVEVLVLAYAHFIFLPPSSLKLLRILSALNLLGVLSALVIRCQPPTSKDEKTLLLVLCRTLFISSSLVSLGLLGALLSLTSIAASAPPIFRAVILSGIIAFPFDTAATFLLYNGRRMRPAGVRVAFRVPALLLYLSSLIPLYLNLPLLYLLFKLAPHIFLALYLWRQLSGGTVASFFERAAPPPAAREDVRRFLRTLVKPVSLALCFEASFLALYSRLALLDSNIGVTLFIAHKAVHLVTVLGIKLDFTILRHLQRAAAVKNERGVRRITAFFFFGSLVYSAVIILALIPLIFERAGLFWLSAQGEYLDLSGPLLALLALLVWLRASAIGLACGSALSPIRRRLFMLALIMSLAPSVYIFTSGSFIFARYSIEAVFAYLLAVDLLCALAVSAALVAALAEAARFCTNAGLDSIIRRLAVRPGPLIFVEFWPEASPSILVSQAGLKSLLARDELIASWGRSCALIAPSDKARCCALKATLVEHFAALIKDLRAADESSGPAAALAQMFTGPLSAAETLYRAAFGRAYLYRATGEHFAKLRETVWDETDQRIRVIDFAADAWQSIPEGELREQAVNYAAAVVRNGPLTIDLWKRKRFSGFFHLNDKLAPAKICYLSPEHRKDIDLLRQTAFQLNLASALAAIKSEG